MNQFNSVLVLYDLEYSVDDERLTIKQGEKLVLISKSSDDWWLVRRPVPYDHTQMTEHRLEPFFVPSAYIQSIDDQNSNNDLKGLIIFYFVCLFKPTCSSSSSS